MGRYFGTDGVRGGVGVEPMTVETVRRIFEEEALVLRAN